MTYCYRPAASTGDPLYYEVPWLHRLRLDQAMLQRE